MVTERVMLKVGSLYRLHGRDGYVLECIRNVHDDGYSPFTAVVRSTLTGWTMKVHGVNQYPDGSIDWDYSTDGMFTVPDKKGVLHQVDYGRVTYRMRYEEEVL